MSKPSGKSSNRLKTKAKSSVAARPLMVRLDEESKSWLVQAAELRKISVSDYVRTVTIAQARREVEAAQTQTIVLTPEEQLAFWKALNATPKLTPAQRRLAKMMRGEA